MTESTNKGLCKDKEAVCQDSANAESHNEEMLRILILRF